MPVTSVASLLLARNRHAKFNLSEFFVRQLHATIRVCRIWKLFAYISHWNHYHVVYFDNISIPFSSWIDADSSHSQIWRFTTYVQKLEKSGFLVKKGCILNFSVEYTSGGKRVNFANVRLHPIKELERVRYRNAIWDCYCERSREHRCQTSCAASNRCLFDDRKFDISSDGNVKEDVTLNNNISRLKQREWLIIALDGLDAG